MYTGASIAHAHAQEQVMQQRQPFLWCFHILQPAAAATIPLVYFTLCSPQQQQPFLCVISHSAARSSSNHSSGLFHTLQPACSELKAYLKLQGNRVTSKHFSNWPPLLCFLEPSTHLPDAIWDCRNPKLSSKV